MNKSAELRIPEWMLWVVGTVIVTGLFVGAMRPKGIVRRPHQCLSNLKQISLGLVMYSNDYDDILPKAGKWMDSIGEYTKNEYLLHDPDGVEASEYGYAFRDKASGLKATSVKNPAEFDLVFDSTLLYRNAHSEPSTMPHPGRHAGGDNVGYLDGHVKWVAVPK